MAMYAFKDAARKVKLFARDAYKEDKGARFYCPNPSCDAHMRICNVDGVSKSYFSASKTHGHIDLCTFRAANSFNPNEFDESAFDFNKALLALVQESNPQPKTEAPGKHGEGPVVPKPPRTIRQIYNMCISYDCTDTYNGITIGTMLLYDQSAYMYPKGVFGWRLIEGERKKPKLYDSSKMEIYLVAPIETKKYTLCLRFTELDLYKRILKMIYANMDHKIIVGGEWGSSHRKKYNEFNTTILSSKQIKIIK